MTRIQSEFNMVIKCGKVLGLRLAIEKIRSVFYKRNEPLPAGVIEVIVVLEKEQMNLDKDISKGG